MKERVIDAETTIEEIPGEISLRPKTLDEYVGQEELKKNLRVFIEAAKARSDALDHVLFHGSPGWARPPSLTSSPTSSRSTSTAPPAP